VDCAPWQPGLVKGIEIAVVEDAWDMVKLGQERREDVIAVGGRSDKGM
jgi:hypothetical protein